MIYISNVANWSGLKLYPRLPGMDNATIRDNEVNEIVRDSGIVSDPSILETPEVMLLRPER